MACAHFFPFCRSSDGGIWRRRVQMVFGRLTVHVPAKSKTDKTRHDQPGPGYHQPMRILHLGEPRHFPFALSLVLVAGGPAASRASRSALRRSRFFENASCAISYSLIAFPLRF